MGESEGKLRRGWRGRFYEDFEPGDVYRSRFGHTVTEADNSLFCLLTHNTNPLHFDREYARNTKWERILVNSPFTLALITGLSVEDVSENALANLGWEEVRLTRPVFVGDTLYCETQVLAKRESGSYPEAGIVTVRSRGINQKGQIVIEFRRNILVYKRDAAPPRSRFPETEEGS